MVVLKAIQGIAVIDPRKMFGEPGQYRKYTGTLEEMATVIAKARLEECELRYYFKDLKTSDGEVVPSQVIITEVPPRHIQPFHTHEKLHELTLVKSGSIIAIDSPDLTEKDAEKIESQGALLKEGEMVLEDPMVRHSIMNPNRHYAMILTVQTARIPLEQFPADWQR